MADERANSRTNHLRDRYRQQQAALRVFRRAQRHLTAARDARVEAERAEKGAADEQAAALAALARLVGDDQVTAAATDLDLAEVAAARKHAQPSGPATHPSARQSTGRTTTTRSRVRQPTPATPLEAPDSALVDDPVTRPLAPAATDPKRLGAKRPS